MKTKILSFVFLLLFSTQVHAETFETNSVVKAEYKENSATTGEIILTMKEGWHVNAHPASMDFLIPVNISLSQKSESLQASYPKGHAIETPLGNLMVYSETVSIPVVLKEEQKLKQLILELELASFDTF